jgi:endonuclease/exonuclease/phosphatase family metal-dependent hydrolase
VTRLLKVATWNIFAGKLWDGSRVDLDLTLATLRRLDADLVAVQEVDRDQGRSHRADQARLLGEALGMEWRYAPALLGTPGSPDGWRAASCCPRAAATSPGWRWWPGWPSRAGA